MLPRELKDFALFVSARFCILAVTHSDYVYFQADQPHFN